VSQKDAEKPREKTREQPEDRAAWARLWQLARSCWPRTEDLAAELLVSRPAVASWATGAERGPWALLRLALRESARRFRDHEPRLVEAMARELFDLHGTWVPDPEAAGEWTEESEDAVVAHGELVQAVRGGGATEIEFVARKFAREAQQAAAAAAEIARRKRGEG
jgi:hypothetical protein